MNYVLVVAFNGKEKIRVSRSSTIGIDFKENNPEAPRSQLLFMHIKARAKNLAWDLNILSEFSDNHGWYKID